MFNIGDVVKGRGPIPFDVHGHEWVVDQVDRDRIGCPCWLKRGDLVYAYPVPSDCLVLVRPSVLSDQERKLIELKRRVDAIERNRW